MANRVTLEGAKELDRALEQLPRASARTTLVRVLRRSGQEIAEDARARAPRDTGRLAESISVSTKLKNPVGKAEFAAAMRAGLGKAAAVGAMRDARRAAGAAGLTSFADMYVGPSTRGPHGHFLEFGTSKMQPQPFMRPAWQATKDRALDIIKRDLWLEIQKTAARVAKRAAAKAAKAGVG